MPERLAMTPFIDFGEKQKPMIDAADYVHSPETTDPRIPARNKVVVRDLITGDVTSAPISDQVPLLI